MKIIILAIFTLFLQANCLCNLPEPCNNQTCCLCRQIPNPFDGNGYLEFNESCLNGGLNCIEDSGCQLCYKPVGLGLTDFGNRPICSRFANLSVECNDLDCCLDMQNPNPSNGNGYLEFDDTCLNGGLNCVGDSGCKLCYKPVGLDAINVGNRPVCTRFLNSSICHDDQCCFDMQDPNPGNGNGFLEFNDTCLNGGLNCINFTGCQLCYKPVGLGDTNVGNRPVCTRFSNLSTDCNDEQCCMDMQNPNPFNGNGYYEYNASCLDGGLNCIGNSGCELCFKPVFGGINVGNRPICERFLNMTTVCMDQECCIDNEFPNPFDGNGYLEYDASCLNGGFSCVGNTGCQLCYKPVGLGDTNFGDRPVCARFT